MRLFLQILGVPRKRYAGVVDNALLHRRGDDRIVFACEAAADGAVENGEHVAAVGRIELAGNARSRERDVLDVRAAGEQRAIADGDDATGKRLLGGAHHSQLTDLGPDPGRLAGSERDDRRLYRSSSRS